MTITHRAAVASAASLEQLHQQKLEKVARLSCCCKLSDLLPLVRQLHDAARAARQSEEGRVAA